MEGKPVAIIIITVLCCLCRRSEASECGYVFAEARLPCLGNTHEECEQNGCCWEQNSFTEDTKCYHKDCKPGYFGWGCRFQCKCKDHRPCDPITGQCPTGCQHGYWGPGCLLENRCAYNDVKYQHYVGRQTRTENGHKCGDWTRQRAYPGPQFPDGSLEDAGNYCRNPKPIDYRTWCYYWKGNSKEWDYCSLVECSCPVGRYGINCQHECHCTNADEPCHQMSGMCKSGCHNHWTGTDCQACSSNYFGEFCEQVCHCRNANESCDKVTGVCQSGCAMGWTGPDCQTECADGRYGYNCESVCNCLDKNEVCSKETGHCVSGCKSGYSGFSCDIEVPVMTRAPTASHRDGTSLTIEWPKWQKPPDRGDGPVAGYYLYYRLATAMNWTTVRADDRQYHLDHLSPDTGYQFKVAAIHQEGHSARASPVLEVSTCGKPLAGPDDITIRPSDQRSRNTVDSPSKSGELQVSWRLPRSPALWGCDSIEKYKIYYKSSDTEDYENIMEVVEQHATLIDINLYKNYTISISLVNNAGMESDLSTDHYIGKSGPVQNLIAKATSTSLMVSWDEPKHSNSHILYYVIRYREQQVGNCETGRLIWTPKVDVDPDQTMYHIKELKPYTTYGIRVWAHTIAGKGQFSTVTVTTEPSEPSAPPADLQQVAVTSTTAKFTWKLPACEARNGQLVGFGYQLTEKSKHQLVRQEVINTTELELLGLVPFTEYSLQVNFINDAFEGPKTLPYTFRTHEDKPPAPRDVAVAETTSHSVVVVWTAPYPPHGVLTNYDVQYQLVNDSNDPVILKVDAIHNNVTLLRLTPNAQYEVKIRAFTSKGGGLWSTVLNFTTEEDIPSKPATFVNISRSTTSITFQWTAPLKQNGRLLNYKILCSPKSPLGQYLAKALEKEMPSETLEYQVGGLKPGTGYICTLIACTSKGCGPAVRKVFYTEPQAPIAPYVPELQPSRTTDTTVTIRIHPSDEPDYGSESVYRIVIEILLSLNNNDRNRRETATAMPCGMSDSELPDYHDAKDKGILCYITAEIDHVDKDSEFTIGDNKTYGQYYNAPLKKGAHYGIWYGLVVTVDGVSQSAYTKINQPVIANFVKRSTTEISMAAFGAAIGIAIVVIIIIVILAILVVRKKKTGCMTLEERSQMTDTERIDGSSVAVTAEVPDHAFLPDLCVTKVEEEQSGDISETSPLCDAVPATDHHYKPILVDDLWSYVQEKKANNFEGLKREYEDIPLGLQHPCEVARRPENKFKNRYGNIIAYDHSRVILDCIDNDPSSDYINANYIDGYRKPNAFVATQGPSKYTLSDIWRMTWQLNSRRIIMVTNLVEDGRHKCEQYWPEGEPRQYDNIMVELVDTEQFADFVIRTFILTKIEDNTTKTVNQLHFTAWPDHGVPNYATSLLAFRKKVRALDDPTAGPTIVHCSAGVGRTGTFIAIDYLLDQAKVEGQVDIYHCVQSMRAKRVNMVQTQEQYNFVYEALLEALKSGDTSISCAVFRRRYRELLEENPDTGRIRLEEEFELLSSMMPPPETVCKDALKPENIDKNRFKDIIPVDNISRAYLLTYTPGSNDYINAVFVDGYKQRDAFIITQMPLPNTVTDFWSMMYDQDCRAIIMMNELDLSDATCACYYPQDVGSQTYGPFAVETISIDTAVEDVIIRDFSLTYNKRGSNETRFIRQFQYTGWPEASPLPKSKSSVIALLGLVEKWQQRSGNKTIVIHCMDGATKSGLFCAISYMVERLKLEQEVDVFQSVKHTRINRPRIVPSLEQYRFVYDMAIEYMDCFETYSNFK